VPIARPFAKSAKRTGHPRLNFGNLPTVYSSSNGWTTRPAHDHPTKLELENAACLSCLDISCGTSQPRTASQACQLLGTESSPNSPVYAGLLVFADYPAAQRDILLREGRPPAKRDSHIHGVWKWSQISPGYAVLDGAQIADRYSGNR
jgi:hypothetical protein